MATGETRRRWGASGVASYGTGMAYPLLPGPEELSAAERFASWKDRWGAGRRGVYRDLLPGRMPAAGEQYAFEVDLDLCSGCKACVAACHALNGLDEGETWRWTGVLQSGSSRHAWHQTVTTACHHCVEPACLAGCPVLAYEKDPVTGIVRHLDDQCIGCQYCIMKCPYEVPQYSRRRGIVRKCDMCSGRLARGEAPACVQACPHHAIRIRLVDTARLRGRFRGLPGMPGATAESWLPDAPDPAITLPATVYKTERSMFRLLRAADREHVTRQPAHWPLVFLLLLTQGAAGLFLYAGLLRAFGGAAAGSMLSWMPVATAAAMVLAGAGVSLLHLGRPEGAWRAFLGLRTSWLSREIVALGLFACGAGLAVVREVFVSEGGFLWPAVAGALGLLTVFCSCKVYDDTRREFWKLRFAGPRFLGSVWLLGGVSALVLASLGPVAVDGWAWIALSVCAGGVFKLAGDGRILRHVYDDDFGPLHKTALVLTGELGRWDRSRVAWTLIGTVVIPLVLCLALWSETWKEPRPWLLLGAVTSASCTWVGEVLERAGFFMAVQSRKMPGNPVV